MATNAVLYCSLPLQRGQLFRDREGSTPRPLNNPKRASLTRMALHRYGTRSFTHRGTVSNLIRVSVTVHRSVVAVGVSSKSSASSGRNLMPNKSLDVYPKLNISYVAVHNRHSTGNFGKVNACG